MQAHEIPWDMIPIEDFLDTQAKDAAAVVQHLNEHGIYLLGDFYHYTELDLLYIPRLGRLRIDRIKEALSAFGCELREASLFEPTMEETRELALAIFEECNEGRKRMNWISYEVATHKARTQLVLKHMREQVTRSPWCYSIDNYPLTA